MGLRRETTSPSTETLHGYVTDHAGSVSVVVDASGSVVETLAYDVWGRRRDPDGTEDPGGSIAPDATRGYTDHEHLPGISLINMNARLYDPEVGRFVSADSIVPDPLASQAYNRYSYVNNNPGSFTDPTGHCAENGDNACSDFVDFIVELVRSIFGDGGLFDGLFGGGDRSYPVFYRAGLRLANVTEDTRQTVPLYNPVNYGTGNLGAGSDLVFSMGGAKYVDGSATASADYTEPGVGWFRRGASTVADFVPFVGQGKAAVQIFTGKDLGTGEDVSRLGQVPGLFPGGRLAGKAVSGIVKAGSGVGSWVGRKVGGIFRSGDDVPNRPRVRHHTSTDGASGITRDSAINPSRGDPPGVHVEREPFGPTSTATDEVGAFGRGRYVEFDEPPGVVPTNVGPRNTGVIPSNGPLDVSDLNPKVGRQ